MATSFRGAKRIATRDGFDIVFHNFDTHEYGACPRGQPQGNFDQLHNFKEGNCLYFPASMSAAEMEDAEYHKIADDPYWDEEEGLIPSK